MVHNTDYGVLLLLLVTFLFRYNFVFQNKFWHNWMEMKFNKLSYTLLEKTDLLIYQCNITFPTTPENQLLDIKFRESSRIILMELCTYHDGRINLWSMCYHSESKSLFWFILRNNGAIPCEISRNLWGLQKNWLYLCKTVAVTAQPTMWCLYYSNKGHSVGLPCSIMPLSEPVVLHLNK